MKKRTENALKLLSDYVKKGANDYPDKTAFVFNEERITYQEFNEKSEILAKYLLEIGVKRQDRIAYLLENQPEFFYLLTAASRIGAIVVGMGKGLMPSELEYIINNSEAEYLFVTGGEKPYASKIASILPECTAMKKIITVGEGKDISESTVFEDILNDTYSELDQELAVRESHVATDDGILIVYSSGTTGKPKGALLSHRNIIHSSLIECDEFECTKDDVLLNNMPLNHVGGVIVAGTTGIINASTIVLLPNFSPRKTMELIEKEKVTILSQVPTQYTMEFNLDKYNEYDKSSLRVVDFGGSMPPKTTIEKVFATMTTNVFNCLGMTEASGIVAYTPRNSTIEELSKSVGKVIPEVEWKLVDKERNPVERGEVGEIGYRGSTIIKEYYKLPEATCSAIDDDGWFYAGDLFSEDENGCLILMGRKHDMFITGGENVYPAEVEEVIWSYGKIDSVAVLPVPDPVYGDIGCAFIVPKPGCKIDEEDLQAYLKKLLAKYKIPQKFIYRKQLPLTPSGKIAKKLLKQEINGESLNIEKAI